MQERALPLTPFDWLGYGPVLCGFMPLSPFDFEAQALAQARLLVETTVQIQRRNLGIW
jgi:hypothetical protein